MQYVLFIFIGLAIVIAWISSMDNNKNGAGKKEKIHVKSPKGSEWYNHPFIAYPTLFGLIAIVLLVVLWTFGGCLKYHRTIESWGELLKTIIAIGKISFGVIIALVGMFIFKLLRIFFGSEDSTKE